MNKIILICFLLVSFFVGKSQSLYPIVQNVGNSPNTIVANNALRGKLILATFLDTVAANAEGFLKNYDGAMIKTTSPINATWWRDLVNYVWIQIIPAGSGGGGTFSWNQGGNNPVVADGSGNAVFGANSNNGISFKTNATSRFILGSTGIRPDTGTTSPIGVGADGYLHYTSVGGGAGWSLTGNSGTNPATNFIGTTDAQDLVLKRNSVETFRLKSGGALQAVGYGGAGLTGTPSTYPAFDASGNLIQSATPYGIYDATVNFSVNIDPNTGGTTFSPNTPQLGTVVYVSLINGGLWTWNGVSYVIYTPSVGGVNIYNSNGTIIGGDRLVELDGNGLTITQSTDTFFNLNPTGKDWLIGDLSNTVAGVGIRGVNQVNPYLLLQTGDDSALYFSNLKIGVGTKAIRYNPGTGLITYTDTTASGSGTVTNVSSANADITVATGTTTPVLTAVQAPALRSATTTVNVSAATAPTSGQVLTATSGTAATWQTPATSGWGLTGNAGTTVGTNFIGTTDNQALSIKTNSSEIARGSVGGQWKLNNYIPTSNGQGTFTGNPKYSAQFDSAGNITQGIFETVEYLNTPFTGGAIPADFTAVGSPTYSVTGGHIAFTGSGGIYNQYIRSNKGVLTESYTFEANLILDAAPSSGMLGCPIGFQSYNANGYVESMIFGLVTKSDAAEFGKSFIYSPYSAVALYSNTANTNTDINSGDTINIRVTRKNWIWHLIVTNITQDWEIRQDLQLTAAATPLVAHNSGYPAIYHLGGSMSVFGLKYTVNVSQDRDMMILGNSITYGAEATSATKRYVELVGQSFNSIFSGGGADVTQSVITRLGEIIAIKPKRVLLHDMAGNDILFGVSTGTWQANLVTIRNALVAAGIQVIWTNGQPRDATNETAQKTYIEATFTNDIVIDTWTPMLGSGTALNPLYTSDGTHPNDLGMVVTADAINSALGYPVSSGGFQPSGTTGYFPYYATSSTFSGTSPIYTDGTAVGIGTATIAGATLNVTGTTDGSVVINRGAAGTGASYLGFKSTGGISSGNNFWSAGLTNSSQDFLISQYDGSTLFNRLNISNTTGGVGIGGLAVASAKLDVQSTTQGFLPPRMTTTQKNAISSPAEGLIVYDLTLHKLCVYTGSAWEVITSL